MFIVIPDYSALCKECLQRAYLTNDHSNRALSVKKITQPVLLPMPVVIMMPGVIVFMIIILILLRGRGVFDAHGRAFNDFIKLPPVEPHAPAIGTIIDFDSLSFRHDQVYVTFGTIHDV